MKVTKSRRIPEVFDAVVIPFDDKLTLFPQTEALLPEGLLLPVRAALREKKADGFCVGPYAQDVYDEKLDRSRRFVLIGLGNGSLTNREVFLRLAKALQSCKAVKAGVTAVLLDNAGAILKKPAVLEKLCELPYLVSYQFNAYRSAPVENGMKEMVLVTEQEGLEPVLEEAGHVAMSTRMARDLVNHPSMYMTPVRFAGEMEQMAAENGLEITVYGPKEMQEMKMGAFLSVARGSKEEPRLIVLRYYGGKADEAPIALVGKSVMFDSGGYSLKSKMATMHDDMGGGAAVAGAIRAIAAQKLPVNVVAVMAACKNMVSGDAYVPGDILFSMNGKTIEMLNSDAEGRLTLADAITYAIRKEGAERIIDIATLTGAAKGAVGARSAAVIAGDETLYEAMKKASEDSCEKIWRLPADQELFEVLRSEVADLKNSNPGNTMGGGTIVAGLFIREFTEGKPWIHVDMAPVNWLAEGNSYSIRGGTGYGVSLLYETVKNLL